MRSIRLPALFELRAHQWRNAVGLHHILQEKDAIVSTEARFACPVDIPNWSAWQDLHLQPFHLERNAPALGYTRWCPRSDLHRHSARFKCAASALGYVGEFGTA